MADPLLDRLAISDLLVEFARRLDGKDWDAYAATFTEDGVFELPWESRVGREEIAAGAAADLSQFELMQHYSTNHVIEIDGDKAHSRSYLLAVHVPDTSKPERHADAGGWYDCECARTSDGWRFTHVRATVAWRAGDPLPFEPRGTG